MRCSSDKDVPELNMKGQQGKKLLRYRTDIDGLRAVAVLSVVLYHLGIFEVPGGFAGVDVFFVISGYLISKIIFSEISEGSFSIVRFYERRCRRILPAFFAVSIVTAFAAYRLFYPQELIDFAHSLLAAALFCANIFFFATSNYFSPAATRLPLLHYWSLGVEEQFYLLFPAVVLGIRRLRPGALQPAIVVSLVLSLLASGFFTQSHPATAFYLLPFRAFELMMGSVLAFPSLREPKDARMASAVTMVGMALLAVSIFCFHDTMIYPGFAAAVPCLGAACVLWGGSGVQTWAYHAFSIRPLRAVGKISYSLYLVHWPIIVFGMQLTQDMNPIVRNTALFLLSIAAASISYYLIEQPFRKTTISSRSRIFGLSSLVIAATVGVAAVIVAKNGFPNRYNSQVARVLDTMNFDYRRAFRLGQCFMNPNEPATDFDVSKCVPAAGKRRAVVWGDSTAADLYAGLSVVSKSYGFSVGQISHSNCPPVVGVYINAPLPSTCDEFNEQAIAEIMKDRPNLVILSSLWWAYWVMSGNNLIHFQQTVRMLRNANIPVIIIGPQPYYDIAVPRIVADKMLNKGDTNERANADSFSDDTAMADVARQEGIPYISVVKTICIGGECLMTSPDGLPLEWDRFHLTTEGSQFFVRRVASDIFDNPALRSDE